jgi:hypothetical protein
LHVKNEIYQVSVCPESSHALHNGVSVHDSGSVRFERQVILEPC